LNRKSKPTKLVKNPTSKAALLPREEEKEAIKAGGMDLQEDYGDGVSQSVNQAPEDPHSPTENPY